MINLHDNVYSSRSENYLLPIPESNPPIRYKSKCNIAIPERSTKYLDDEFNVMNDYTTGLVHDLCVNEENNAAITVQITAKVNNNEFHKAKVNDKINNREFDCLVNEPSCEVNISLSNIKQADCGREFGIIQSSKMETFDREYVGRTVRTDFASNILKKQDELLDNDGNNIPFYSTDSYSKVEARHCSNEKFNLRLIDVPDCETSLYFDGRPLLNVERFQSFSDYFVERYWYNLEWKYIKYYTFEWFIYSNLRENKCECGIIRHGTPRELPNINFYPNCNDDQFVHYIDHERNTFHILKYPAYEVEGNIFYEDIKNNVVEFY